MNIQIGDIVVVKSRDTKTLFFNGKTEEIFEVTLLHKNEEVVFYKPLNEEHQFHTKIENIVKVITKDENPEYFL